MRSSLPCKMFSFKYSVESKRIEIRKLGKKGTAALQKPRVVGTRIGKCLITDWLKWSRRNSF